MDPYLIPLIVVPTGITIVASLLKNRLWKWVLLFLATLLFWVILQPSVQWAFTHPFNPNDGAPRTFALLFGWAYGLLLVVIPTYWISKGIQLIRKRTNPNP
jgi:apolipoprotein N-acyltransferase